jgi:anti-sigma factor RsiW
MSARERMHLTDEQLDDYVDGAMPDAERASAQRHLDECDRCLRALGDTREVLAWATRERATVSAPAELWPLVASSTIHLAEVRRAVLRSMRGLLIAGAIAVAGATAVVTWKIARWTMPTPVVPTRAEQPGVGGPGRHAGHPVVPIPPKAPTPPRPPEAPRP